MKVKLLDTVENMVSKGEMVLSNFFFSKKPSAAEASDSVYMRERIKGARLIVVETHLLYCCLTVSQCSFCLPLPIIFVNCLGDLITIYRTRGYKRYVSKSDLNQEHTQPNFMKIDGD